MTNRDHYVPINNDWYPLEASKLFGLYCAYRISYEECLPEDVLNWWDEWLSLPYISNEHD